MQPGPKLEPQAGDLADVERAIDAEFEDHLASAAAALAQRGAGVDDAQRLAGQAFGDVTLIKRRCWWIQQGDRVMFRAVTIGLMLMLCAALVAMAIGGWHLNARLQDLATVLADLKEKQAGERPAAAVPEITGFCFLKDRKHPAAGAQVELRELPEMTVLRRFQADTKGRFRSGPVSSGDYALLAPLQGSEKLTIDDDPAFATQSQPLYVSEGTSPEGVALDVYFASGHATVELKTELPDTIELPKPRTAQPIMVNVLVADNLFPLPWKPNQPLPPKWPVVGKRHEFQFGAMLPPKAGARSGVSFYPNDAPMPAGRYWITATLAPGNPAFGGGGGFFNVADNKNAFAMLGYSPPKESVTELTLADGEDVTLEIHFSDDTVDQLRKAMVANPDALTAALVYGTVKIASRQRTSPGK